MFLSLAHSACSLAMAGADAIRFAPTSVARASQGTMTDSSTPWPA
jgi:hypothetical protein